ncbi:MAG: secretin N-terminal domain-containing protein [Gammaproteobacteria bacterium]|nr:secretin N-terminal domain-containing protein [Gammaproteobacteria bacterium]
MLTRSVMWIPLLEALLKSAPAALRTLAVSAVFMLLAACGANQQSAPQDSVISSIQDTLDEAAETLIVVPEAPSQDIINEILPALTINDELLTPMEDRFNIVANRESAQSFFSNLVAGTQYGVAVSPDVEGEISLSLPDVTIEEVMFAVQETYGYQVTRNGNIYRIQPAGLQTRIFSVDYLNITRMGTSSVQVSSSSSSSQGGGNNNNNNGGTNNSGGFNNSSGNTGNTGSNNNNGTNGNNTSNSGSGGGAGGQVSTETESNFWEDFEAVIATMIGAPVQRGDDSSQSGGGGGLLAGLAGGGGGGSSSSGSAEGRSVVVQPQVGLVMVTALPAELDRVADYIARAQNILSREVTIQVQFLEVILNKGFQSAIDFDTFGIGGAELTNNTVTGQFGSTGGSNIQGISGPLSIATNFTDFNAVFQILESRGTTQVLSSPSLKVMNNQKAVFQDGDEEYFQTGQNATTVAGGNNTTTSNSASLQPFFSGISMDITPQISAEGRITLHIHPTISTVVEQSKSISGAQVPLARTSVRELDSVIRGEDGKIVVLGGLAYERSVEDVAGIPVVNDLPVVGAAFDQRRRQTVKSEFIILLRPVIASPDTEERFIRDSNDRFRQLNQDINPFQ